MSLFAKYFRVFLASLGLLIILSGCSGEPDNIDSIKLKSKELIDNGEYLEAVEIIRKGLDIAPSNRDLLFLMGTAFKKHDIFDSALVYFTRGRILNKRDRDFNRELAELCPMYKDYSTAISAIASLVLTGDSERLYWPRLADLYYLNGEYSLAIKYYKLLIAEDPNRISIYSKLASTLAETRKFDEAAAVMRDLIETAGPSAEVYGNIGVYYMAGGRIDEAEAALRRSISIDGRNVPIQINLANLLAGSSDREKRIEALEFYKLHVENAPPGYKLDSLIKVLEEDLGQ